MADIKDQLIKDSYNYVLQSDLSTGVVYRIGGSVPVNPIFSSGLTVNSGFTYSNGTEQSGYALLTDGTGYAYWGPVSGTSGNYLPLSGGTVTGNTIFQSGLTANTISATTYYNLPTDVFVTGGTYSNGTLYLTNNTGHTFNIPGFSTATGNTNNYYGSFSDTTTQVVNGANTPTAWSANTTEISNGIYIVDGSKITVSNDGIYEIGYSAQIEKTQGVGADVTIWAKINGNNVARSSSTISLVNNSVYSLPFVSYIFDLYAGDQVEFYFSSPSDHIQITTLSGLTTPTRPVSPSLIIVAKAIGNAVLSNSGDSYVTGFTLTNNNLILSQNRVGQYSGFTVNLPYLNTSGGTITGNLSVTGTTSSGTISATTYQNLPFSGTVTGGGTINYVPKWTGSTGLGNSQIFDDGTNVGIGTTSPSAKLDIITPSSSSIGLRVSGDSTTDLFRITQTGSGNAIVVEDDTNPDSTPFVVAADGRVGIGLTAPLSSYRLHVRNGTATSSAAAAGTVATFEGSGATYVTVLSPDASNSGFAFGSDSDRFGAFVAWNHNNNQFSINTDKVGAFISFSTDDQFERMRITSAGNVGIGTTSPSAKLDVISSTSGSTPILRVSGASSVEAVRITQTGGGFALVVEDESNPDSNSFVVDSAGRVGIGYGTGTTLAQALTINGVGTATTSFIAPTLQATTLYPQNDNNLNIRTRDGGAGNRDILFGTGNSGGTPFTRMTIASTGNVGIGTTSPSARLDVSGDTLLRSGVTLSNLSSSANTRFIVSDSNGVLSYRTDVLTGTTITITGGTNIQIVGSYPNFGVNFTGGTILKYYTSGSTPTGTINDGDRWFNTTDGVELVYVTDINGSQWVQPNNGGSNTGTTSVGDYLPLSGGTVTGLTTFTTGITYSESIGVDRYSGEIVKFGAGNTSASTLYYYSSGNWSLTDANSTTTSTKMLGIGISPDYTTSGNPSTDGILVRGYARLYYPGTWNDGDILYVADNNLGLITNIAPTTSTYVVRIIGYVVDGASNLIYFCPDNTWIELV